MPTLREINSAEAKTLDPLWMEIEAEREKGNVHRERKRAVNYQPMAMAWLAAANTALHRPGVDMSDPWAAGVAARVGVTIKRVQRIEARWGHALETDPIETFAKEFIKALGEEVERFKRFAIPTILAIAGALVALAIVTR